MNQGWIVKKLGEICEIFNGGTPDTKTREYWSGDILWITPKDMGKLQDIYVYDTDRKITKAGLKNSSAKLLPVNSIILSSRAPIGHLAINKKEISTNQGCKGLVPKGSLDPKYLYYFLKKSVGLLNDLGSGTTFKEISGAKLTEIEIPLPPLPEQRRIVAILDEAFAAIAKAKENTEKNLQNARELFQSTLNTVFANPGSGWEEKKLKDICLIRPPKSEVKQKLGDSDLVSFIPMEDLGICQKNFLISRSRPLKEVFGSYTYFAEEDVLLAKITPCFENGKLGIARNLTNSFGFGSSEYFVFRANENLFNEYLFYFFSREKFRIEGAQRMSGAVGHKRVAKDFIENSLISLPPLPEQRRIVSKLNKLSTEIQNLETLYKQKLADLAELQGSILHNAFDGELTKA